MSDDRHQRLAEIEELKRKLQPLPARGQDFAFTERPGKDRAEIAQRYEQLGRHDDAVRWYLEAADYCSAIGHYPAAYAFARLGLKVNPLDANVRERLAVITAQLGLSDNEA